MNKYHHENAETLVKFDTIAERAAALAASKPVWDMARARNQRTRARRQALRAERKSARRALGRLIRIERGESMRTPWHPKVKTNGN